MKKTDQVNNMGTKLEEFIIKQLNDKKKQRWIISSEDLYVLCGDMGIIDDDTIMIDVLKYLDENKIDINFHGKNGDKFYREFIRLENKMKLLEKFKNTKPEMQKLIEKAQSISVPERPEWLESYRNDEDSPDLKVSTDDGMAQFQRITDMLKQELREQIENEPVPTIEELQTHVEMEMGLPQPFNMNELNANELVNFLTNRVIPERFRENNNN